MTGLRITQLVVTGVFAGTERYVVDVSLELARRGHDVRVVGGDSESMLRALAGVVRWQPGADARTAAAALLGGGRRDVVHSHMTKADYVSVATRPRTRARTVSTRHITVPRGYSAASRRMAPLVRSRLDREIAVSAWTSDQLERPADVVLLNGVTAVPDASHEPEPVVLVAQRLAPEKDTATAVRGFARSGLADRGWRLLVAGSGEQRADLERLVTDCGVGAAVEFLGWVGRLDDVYARTSVLLAPAPTEPCGLTVIEAMARGIAVVAAGAAGHLETVGGDPAAALFAPGDVAAVAAHLVRLADDPDERRRYGASLRDRQRAQFTITAHVDRLEQLYRGLSR